MTRARSISRLVSDQVTGNVNISGILTATTLFGEGSGITGVTAVGSGVTILDNGVNKGAASKIDFADHFLVTDISSGITTITVGITTENINSNQINNTGITTTASLSVTGGTNLDNLTVSGVSTSTTVNSTILNATDSNLTNLNVSGIATITELNIGNAGAEIAGFTTMTTGGYSTIGVVTATAFVGDGSNITGINTSQIETSTLVVSGISTLGKLDIADQTVELTFNEGVGLETKNINATGIITATSFSGDGSQLTGVGTENVRTSSLVVSGVSTFSNDVLFEQVDGTSKYIQWDKSAGTLNFGDTAQCTFGEFNDLRIFHNNVSDEGHSFISHIGPGNLRVSSGPNGSTEIQHNTTTKLQTLGTGVTITGTTFTNTLNVSGIATVTELTIGNAGAEIIGFTTITPGGIDVVGVVTATNGFVSSANTSPVQIQVVGNQLIFNVVGIGSTTLTLA